MRRISGGIGGRAFERAATVGLAPALALTAALGLATSGSPPATSATSATSSPIVIESGATDPSTSAPGTIAPISPAQQSPAGTFWSPPTVTVPTGSPPAQLESADLITGAGRAAESGDALTVQYVLATYSSRKVVESTWTSRPFTFSLGVGQVLLGWEKGIIGMRQGGRRELIIPPELGYGESSPGPGVGYDDTLVYVIDLISVTAP